MLRQEPTIASVVSRRLRPCAVIYSVFPALRYDVRLPARRDIGSGKKVVLEVVDD